MKPYRIGTRGSPLALAQAHETRSRLMAAHGLPEDAFEIVVLSSKGDRITDRPLSEIGGKGLFTEELEEQLSDGRLDLAVHSSKDMATKLPEGLGIVAYLEREDPPRCLHQSCRATACRSAAERDCRLFLAEAAGADSAAPAGPFRDHVPWPGRHAAAQARRRRSPRHATRLCRAEAPGQDRGCDGTAGSR